MAQSQGVHNNHALLDVRSHGALELSLDTRLELQWIIWLLLCQNDSFNNHMPSFLLIRWVAQT